MMPVNQIFNSAKWRMYAAVFVTFYIVVTNTILKMPVSLPYYKVLCYNKPEKPADCFPQKPRFLKKL